MKSEEKRLLKFFIGCLSFIIILYLLILFVYKPLYVDNIEDKLNFACKKLGYKEITDFSNNQTFNNFMIECDKEVILSFYVLKNITYKKICTSYYPKWGNCMESKNKKIVNYQLMNSNGEDLK